MKCLFCDEDIKALDNPSECYIIATEYSIGKRETHIHIHGSLDDRKGIISLVEAILRETQLEDVFVKQEKKG